MSIKLVSKEEKFTIKLHGCEFYYRRLPMDEAERLRDANTERGELDRSEFYKDVFHFCLIGWNGVQDAAGEDAPFSHEAALALPDPVMKDLIKTMSSTVGGEEAIDGPDPF